jgi:hypothetical protein
MNGVSLTSGDLQDPTRTRNLYRPGAPEPYKLSRSKLEGFLRCPRCFYLDRRLGIGQPQGPTPSLNVAVDALMKREFDAYRARGEAHELMLRYGVEAVPLRHPDLEEWRDNARGVQHLHASTNLLVHGSIDDAWITPEGKLHVVDYKATSFAGTVSMDGPWREAYKRQIEIYQWLLRQRGYDVSDIGYFVFVNADKQKAAFDGKLEFVTVILPYVGDASWVDEALQEAHTCLCRQTPPQPNPACEWCGYRKSASSVEQW